MIPVYQTIFYEPGVPYFKQRGNCLQAVVASMLEVPLGAVPHFVEIDEKGGPNWWWFLRNYLAMMGKRQVPIYNWSVRNPPAGVYYALSGKSKRGSEDCPIYHIVIFKDGKLVHDPVKDGGGNLTYEEGWYLEDIEPRFTNFADLG